MDQNNKTFSIDEYFASMGEVIHRKIIDHESLNRLINELYRDYKIDVVLIHRGKRNKQNVFDVYISRFPFSEVNSLGNPVYDLTKDASYYGAPFSIPYSSETTNVIFNYLHGLKRGLEISAGELNKMRNGIKGMSKIIDSIL